MQSHDMRLPEMFEKHQEKYDRLLSLLLKNVQIPYEVISNPILQIKKWSFRKVTC